MSRRLTDADADRIAGWVVGVGLGFLGFMTTWLLMARITERLLAAPLAPIVAMVVAIVTGVVVAARYGRRLAAYDYSEQGDV